jgi:outer membrane biosynthesis protein TonB
MSTNPPLHSRGMASGRFWRNVTLIALAHVAMIAVLIRWSLEARSAPDAQSLVWLSGAEDLLPEKSESSSLSAKIPAPSIETEPSKPEETEKERSSLTQTKSEIDLATPQPTPKPVATPVTKTVPTPKVMKKTVLAKTSKASARPKSSVSKSKKEQTDAGNEKTKSEKTVSAKSKSSPDRGDGKTGSAGKGGSAGGGSKATEFGWYGNMLHDRFYSAWIQPTTTVASGTKISTLVKVRIDKDGHVSRFEIIKPSENVVVNESVAVIAKRVTEVDSPPTGLINGDHYEVKINFELNTNRETAR